MLLTTGKCVELETLLAMTHSNSQNFFGEFLDYALGNSEMPDDWNIHIVSDSGQEVTFVTPELAQAYVKWAKYTATK